MKKFVWNIDLHGIKPTGGKNNPDCHGLTPDGVITYLDQCFCEAGNARDVETDQINVKQSVALHRAWTAGLGTIIEDPLRLPPSIWLAMDVISSDVSDSLKDLLLRSLFGVPVIEVPTEPDLEVINFFEFDDEDEEGFFEFEDEDDEDLEGFVSDTDSNTEDLHLDVFDFEDEDD